MQINHAAFRYLPLRNPGTTCCPEMLPAGALNELFANSTLAVANVNATEASAIAEDAEAVALGLADSATSAIVSIAPSALSGALGETSDSPTLWYILGAISTLVAFIYILSMCVARKKIKTAVALTKESTVVIKARPMTMFFPFGTLAVQVGFLLFFLLLAAFLGTANLDSSHFGSGAVDAVTRSSTFVEALAWFNSTMASEGVQGIQDADNSRTYVQIAVYTYVLFGLLWTINCVTNTSWTAMSGSVCHWYFFRDAGDDSPAKTKAPLARSLGRVLWYHLGTIAFGSFIIAVIQLIRIILMAVDRYTKNAQKSNLLLWLALKCCACCMWCLEKTVKYITGYAYIYVALQGSAFCSACMATFNLIFSCAPTSNHRHPVSNGCVHPNGMAAPAPIAGIQHSLQSTTL